MSLRNQIISRIIISSLCMILLGGAIAIWQARQAVNKEVEASMQLALQLIRIGVSNLPASEQIDDLSHFRAFQQTRHLRIQMQKPDGKLIEFKGDNQPSNPEKNPPAWFIYLVQSNYQKLEQQIQTKEGKTLTLIIQAQPLDEITEIWEESVAFFASILVLTLLSFVTVNLVINKSLKSIDEIVSSLREIVNGQYQHKLAKFPIEEFDKIANAINHLMFELEKARLENRALTQHSLAIQEDERQRLSQELHDEFAQSLTAIKVMAITVAYPQTDKGKISSSIAEICDHLMTVVRSMMQQLHPLVLTDLGLKATLEELVNNWSERNPNLNLTIVCCNEIDQIDKIITIQIFRVIQECLTNVIRHAHAQQVTIELEISDKSQDILQLKVQDNGQGCDLKNVSQGFGLLGIKERIKSLGGQITLHSALGSGMTVTACIPIK